MMCEGPVTAYVDMPAAGVVAVAHCVRELLATFGVDAVVLGAGNGMQCKLRVFCTSEELVTHRQIAMTRLKKYRDCVGANERAMPW